MSLHRPAGRKRISTAFDVPGYPGAKAKLLVFRAKEIGARHPSLQRYLGRKSESFPGQDALHFRVLLAEVVAEALCARRLEGNVRANPGDFKGMTWDDYYRHFAELMSRFLPNAHRLMAPEIEGSPRTR